MVHEGLQMQPIIDPTAGARVRIDGQLLGPNPEVFLQDRVDLCQSSDHGGLLAVLAPHRQVAHQQRRDVFQDIGAVGVHQSARSTARAILTVGPEEYGTGMSLIVRLRYGTYARIWTSIISACLGSEWPIVQEDKWVRISL